MTKQTELPQPADGLRQYIAEALAKEAGSTAFREPSTAWDHSRSEWLGHADTALNALHRWEQQGTLHRLCVIPGCFEQLNVSAPAPGWFNSTAVGYACPGHAQALWGDGEGAHVPRWGYRHPADPECREALLRCTCGWDAGPTRFRGHGTVLWQAHALEVLEAGR